MFVDDRREAARVQDVGFRINLRVERSRYAAEKSKMVYTPRICPISGIYKKGVYIMIPTEVNRFE
ncbi:MAG: hypothetical protein WA081_18125, partial [Desulfosalsimonadaceae bacterium]